MAANMSTIGTFGGCWMGAVNVEVQLVIGGLRIEIRKPVCQHQEVDMEGRDGPGEFD